MAQYAVFVEGLESLKDFHHLKGDIRMAAVQAINGMAESGRTAAARAIRDSINFPASYLQPGAKRLYVSKKATRGELEARIRARRRATSLARFIQGSTKPNKMGVTVQVARGKARHMKRAFVIRLPAGSADIDTKSNLGLAIRLRKGETLRNKKNVVRMEKGLYLLYGPSIQQVFMSNDGSGVAEDIAPDVLRGVDDEFHRIIGARFGR